MRGIIVKELWKAFKEGQELWDWLGFCLFMNNFRKANDACDKIDEYEKRHPILNAIAMWFH